MSRCVILCAGPVEEPEELKPLLRPEDFVLAADGGQRLARRLGVSPAAVLADFDSSEAPADGTRVLRLPVRKDETDAAAAAEYAIEKGCREFLILGGTGGRLDHQYANLLLLVRLARRGCRAMLADEKNRIEAVCASPVFPRPMEGWSLSLFAFGEPVEGLTTRGTEYDLTDYTLSPENSLAVSNRALANCSVRFRKGTLLLYRSKD